MKNPQKKSDYEHVLTKLFNAAVGEPIDLVIRKTCTNRGMIDLIGLPRSRLEQISFQNRKETIKLKHYEVGKISTLGFYVVYRLADELTALFRFISISSGSFNEFRVSNKHRKLREQHG